MVKKYSIKEHFVHLLCDAIHGQSAKIELAEEEWKQLYRLSVRHNVANLIYLALEKQLIPYADIWALFRKQYLKSITVDTVQRKELDWILEMAQIHKFRVMPLKGCVLKQLYPHPSMRTMGDIDFLIDQDHAGRLREILCTNGYTCGSYGKHYHDIYMKKPMLMLEPHISLTSTHDKKILNFFRDGF